MRFAKIYVIFDWVLALATLVAIVPISSGIYFSGLNLTNTTGVALRMSLRFHPE
jgi:hypothetical protein